MSVAKRIAKQKKRRGFRIGNRVRRDAHGRMRLSVFRSNKHMYAQVIDDTTGQTIVAASTVEKSLGGAGKAGGNKEAAAKVGAEVAKRAVDKGVTEVVFDRGRSSYHGRIAALADAAREAGLKF